MLNLVSSYIKGTVTRRRQSKAFQLNNERPRPVADIVFMAQLPPPVHGLTAISRRVLEHLNARGCRVTFKSQVSASSMQDLGIWSLRKLFALGGLLAWICIENLRGKRYDAVYLTFTPGSKAVLRDALLVSLSRTIAQRVIAHVHTEGLGAVCFGQSLFSYILQNLIRGAEVITVTDGTADAAVSSGLFQAVHLIPNSVPDPGAPFGIEKDDESDNSPNKLRCVYLGNYDRRKGLVDFLDIIERLNASGVEVSASVLGAPSRCFSAQELSREISYRRLNEIVEVKGFANAVLKEKVFREADLFIYPTRHDHAPLVLIEALSFGVVPLALDVGGIRDMLGPEMESNVVSHTLKPRQAVDCIIDRVALYAANPEVLAKDSRLARSLYEQKFSTERFQKNLDYAFGLPTNITHHSRGSHL